MARHQRCGMCVGGERGGETDAAQECRQPTLPLLQSALPRPNEHTHPRAEGQPVSTNAFASAHSSLHHTTLTPRQMALEEGE